MYSWNLRQLKQELVRGHTAQQSFPYVLALLVAPGLLHMVLRASSALILQLTGPHRPQWTAAELQSMLDSLATSNPGYWLPVGKSLEVIALGLGLIYCYRQNGGAAGRDLLPRLVPLAWVALVRTTVLVTIPLYLVGTASDAPDHTWVSFPSWPTVIGPTVTAAVALLIAGSNLRDVAIAGAAVEGRTRENGPVGGSG